MPFKDKEARLKYQREWVAKRRQDFFSDKYCVQCGSAENLQLDHIDPSRKVDHRIWSWSQERREAEIAKCQILCDTCHKAKTANDVAKIRWGRDFAFEHGTVNMYRKEGCRCPLCTKANTDCCRRVRQRRASLG